MLPPEAKATLSVECAPPALVDESFGVTVVAAANEDDIRGGALTIEPASGTAVDGAKVLSTNFAPIPPEGVRSTDVINFNGPARLMHSCLPAALACSFASAGSAAGRNGAMRHSWTRAARSRRPV